VILQGAGKITVSGDMPGAGIHLFLIYKNSSAEDELLFYI
jgi:hypothetical protein